MTQRADDPPSVQSPSRVKRPIRVCFILGYRAPDYIRGRTICSALADSGAIALTLAVNRSHGLARYWQAIRALLRVRSESDPEVYILGFRGIEIAWLVRWITRGKPLVIDALLSPYAVLKEEAKLGRSGRLLAPFWRRYEHAMLHQADVALTDTELHARYYRTEFGLPPDRIVAVPVGADEAVPLPAPLPERKPSERFRVLFYGSFLPLHGMDVIIEAAVRVAELPIEFHFIGGTRTQASRFIRSCESHGLRNYVHRLWVPFDGLLRDEIPRADLCLGGPFGGTPQARRVVTSKTSQCLASGKATVVGRIEEDYGFVDRENCLLVEQGDAEALAAALRWAHAHRDELATIGRRGQALYAERLSTRVIAERLVPLVHRLTSPHMDTTI